MKSNTQWTDVVFLLPWRGFGLHVVFSKLLGACEHIRGRRLHHILKRLMLRPSLGVDSVFKDAAVTLAGHKAVNI